MLAILPFVLAEVPPVPPWIAASAHYTVHLQPGESVAHITLEYQFAPVHEGWFSAQLAGPELVVDQATGPVSVIGSGLGVVLPPSKTPITVSISGTLLAQNGQLSLPVLPAVRQDITWEAPGLDVTVEGAIDHVLSAQSRLMVHYAPARTQAPLAPPPLVRAETASAFWEESGELRIETALRLIVLRGSQQHFTVNLTGLRDVNLSGENLAHWEQQGENAIIDARAPVTGTLELRISGRAPIPQGEFTVPEPIPQSVLRVEHYHMLAASEEIDLAPAGGRTIASTQVPSWGRSLSERSPVVWWQGPAPQLRPERYSPELGPDTVIERAELLVVANDVGTVLLRSTWYVRNERRQYLHFQPAPGFKAVAARRGSVPVPLLSDGAGGLYIALERSVETVQGPMSMPLEITWIGSLAPFEKKKGDFQLSLPSVDAPIQTLWWQVHLPRGYVAGRKEEEQAYIPVYDPTREMAEDSIYNAVNAWRENDFSGAQQWVDQARSLGSNDENVDRLQSNLDLILNNTLENSNSDKDDANARRVREMAAARAEDMKVVQEEAEKKAEDALRAGDLEEAERQYETVVVTAQQLQLTEQAGSEEQRARYSSASSGLAEVKKQKKSASISSGSYRMDGDDLAQEDSGKTKNEAKEEDDKRVEYKARTEIDFESVDITGTVVMPLIEQDRNQPVVAGIPVKSLDDSIEQDGDGIIDTFDNYAGTDELSIALETPTEAVPADPAPAGSPAPPPKTTEEYLERIPTGRSYQDVVQTVAGVAGGRVTAGVRGGQKSDSAAHTESTTTRDTRDRPEEPAQPAKAPPPPVVVPEPVFEPEAIEIVDEEIAIDAISTGSTRRAPALKSKPKAAATPTTVTTTPQGVGGKGNVRGPDEGRLQAPAFAQKPTPLTLALPLSGYAVYRQQTLLDPGTFPSLTITYRRGEN